VKRSLLVLFVLSAALLMFGQTITLEYWMWDPEFREQEQRAINAFEAENPGIKVNMTALEPRDYWTKLSAMAAAGRLPDVFNMSSGYAEQWAADGLLLNIQEYAERDIDMEDYFSGVFDIFRYPQDTGPLYAFPFAWVTTGMFYNKDAFDEAGIAYPTDDWTWDEFLAAAEALTVDKNGDGFIDQWGYWWYGRYAQVDQWIYQNDGDLLSECRTQFVLDDNALEAIKFLLDLTLVHGYAPTIAEVTGIRQQDVFPLGMAAMWTDGVWNIENIRSIAGDDFRWGIARVPRGPKWVEDVAYSWPDGTAIASTTAHAEAAWKFLVHITGEGKTIDEYMGGKVPSLKSLAYDEAWLELDKQPGEEKGVILEWGTLETKNNFTMGWSEWRGYGAAETLGLNGAIDAVIHGDMTFEEAIRRVTREAQAVLDRYYK